MTPPSRERWRWIPWVVLAAVLSVALAVGATTASSGPLSASQRAARIDATLRCPSCEGISVADSSASTAAAIRQAVATRVRSGQSDAQIEAYVVSRYGPSILLRPPARGPTVWVWVLPPLGVVVAGAALGALFWRRRRVAATEVSDDDRTLVDQALADRAGSRRAGSRRAGSRRARPDQARADEALVERALQERAASPGAPPGPDRDRGASVP